MSETSKQNQIFIAVGVAAVLGGLYYMQRKNDAANTNTAYSGGAKTSAAPQFKIVPEEVDKLSIKAKEKAEVVLEKKAEGWSMAAPTPGAKIQKSSVDDVLNALKGITFKETIAQGANNFAGYELDDGKGIHVVAYKGGVAIIDVWLGAQKSRGQMARLGNDQSGQVWSVTGVSAFSFDKGPKDVRDRKIWDLNRDDIVSIELKTSKATFAFAKNEAATPTDAGVADATAPAPAKDGGADGGDAGGPPPAWLGMVDGKPIAGLEVPKVDDLINAFALGGVLNADDFGDGKSEAETGLGADATVFSFKKKDGTFLRITLGKTDGTKRFARKEGDATTYLLGEGPSGWAAADLGKFAPSMVATGDAGADGEAGGASDAAPDAKK